MFAKVSSDLSCGFFRKYSWSILGSKMIQEKNIKILALSLYIDGNSVIQLSSKRCTFVN